MSQPQKGVCAQPNLHAQYLMFNVIDDDIKGVRQALAGLLTRFDYYDQEYYEAMVSGMIAIGTNYWPELYPEAMPIGLMPFPDVSTRQYHSAVVPFDLFIQIRADRFDVCYALAMDVCKALSPYTELAEQVQGFRFKDGRDLTGFIEGGDNPQGMAKLNTAIVGDEDLQFAGGSYVHVQRYQHNLARWEMLTMAEQEQVMGRTKEENQPIDEPPTNAHWLRTQVSDWDGNPLRLLNQSMPYGNLHEQGLYFVSCAAQSLAFAQRLRSMLAEDDNGNIDAWLEYTEAETGAAFFAPSVQFLRAQGKG